MDVMRESVPAASGSNTSALCRRSSLRHTWFSITQAGFSLEAIHHFYRTSVLHDATEQEEISDIFIESPPAPPLFPFYYGDCHQSKFWIFTNSFRCFTLSMYFISFNLRFYALQRAFTKTQTAAV